MKKILFPVVFFFFSIISNAQTVEQIRVEQDGDNLKVHYRIGGSTADQLYFVTLTCSIDGGPEFEPRSVMGDVGANIRGGKSFNTVVWDVFEDVEEIGSVEFFVKVDLTSETKAPEPIVNNTKPTLEVETKTPSYINNSPGPYYTRYVSIDGSTTHPLGIRAGIINNWGAYVAVRFGGYDYLYDPLSYYVIDEGYLTALLGGVTKRFVGLDKFRLYGYTGMGVGIFMDGFEMELGLTGVFGKRFVVSAGGTINYYYSSTTFGLGIAF